MACGFERLNNVQCHSEKIENVQKACLYVILGSLATNDYYCNLTMVNLEPLCNRREKLFRNLARKTFKRSKQKVHIPLAKTARYEKSAIPNLARVINTL